MHWTTAAAVIGSWIGEDAPEDTDKVEIWIGRAERLIRREVPDLEERIAEGTEPDLLDTVRDIVAEMVTEVFRNPDGARTRQETAGQFSGSVTYSGDTPGRLELTPKQLATLTKGGAVVRKAGSVSLIPLESPFHPSKWTTP